ncbi:MAG: hypothetical protein WBD04_07940 [Candidatus Omnitrophota bacterium]
MSGVEDLTKTIIIVASLSLIVATFININIGLAVILLSMLLSPELEAGSAGGRAVVIRVEDLVLIIVSVTWLAKMAIEKALPLIRKSPLNAPIGLYVAILCISTLRAMLQGGVSPLKGTFYVLKLSEYFMLYFIVYNHVNTSKQVKLFLGVLLFTGFIVGIYGNTHIGKVERLAAPFEGHGEPNTLGGYLLFILCIVAGLVMYYKKGRNVLVLIFLFLVPTFIFTLSRASYLGMIPALFVLAILTNRKAVINSVLIVFVAFALFVALGPPKVKKRILTTFKPIERQKLKRVGVVPLGPSPAARVKSWKDIMLRDFPRKPLLGYGLSGGIFLDSQYVLAINETGIIGFLLFLWLMWRIWRSAYGVFRTVEDPLYKGLAVGYLTGFVGLLVHAIGTNTFIIIRIAEPFWFFTAVVLKLRDIETGKVKEQEAPWQSPWH